MINYHEKMYPGVDGLSLYVRDYGQTTVTDTLLLIPGLTRNADDFNDLAQWLAKKYRVLAVDLRGRGRSSYDTDSSHYNPAVYSQDMFCLLDYLAISSVTVIGTSLGGLIAMLMKATHPERINKVVLNDIGPDINPKGLARINSYVGKLTTINNWEDAINATRTLNEEQFPGLSDAQWLAMTRALYREDQHGVPHLAYDPKIADAAVAGENATEVVDIWPLFDSLIDTPLLVIRGELSDILDQDCIDKMRAKKPDMHYQCISNRGHAPLLNEASALDALANFLSSAD